MKRLLIGAALCALSATPGLAGEPAKVTEPVRLSLTQMDGVTAGDFCKFCSNINATHQTAVAVGGAAFSLFSGNASAVNVNETDQEIN
jgi:hypothetical protein